MSSSSVIDNKGVPVPRRPGVDHDYHDYANVSPAEVNLLFPASSLAAIRQHNPLASGAQQQGFAVKLHYMLADIETNGDAGIVSWRPHGRCVWRCGVLPVRTHDAFQLTITDFAINWLTMAGALWFMIARPLWSEFFQGTEDDEVLGWCEFSDRSLTCVCATISYFLQSNFASFQRQLNLYGTCLLLI